MNIERKRIRRCIHDLDQWAYWSRSRFKQSTLKTYAIAVSYSGEYHDPYPIDYKTIKVGLTFVI